MGPFEDCVLSGFVFNLNLITLGSYFNPTVQKAAKTTIRSSVPVIMIGRIMPVIERIMINLKHGPSLECPGSESLAGC
jgi:hypothetical protein